MKLYNLYQEVIFEESQKQLKLLSEGASTDEIEAAIEGKYNVRIYYRDHDDGTPPSKRYVQIYNLGMSKANNQVIRAFQINGFTNHPDEKNAWKIFRVDRIEKLEPTKMPWYNPMSDYRAGVGNYNYTGDKEIPSISAIVDPDTFNRERLLKNLGAKQNKQMPEPEPVYNKPEPEPKPVPAPVKRRPAQPTEPRPTEPRANEPRANVPRTNAPRTNEPRTNAPRANAPKPNVPRANEPRRQPNEPNLGNDKEEEKDIYGNTNPAIR